MSATTFQYKRGVRENPFKNNAPSGSKWAEAELSWLRIIIRSKLPLSEFINWQPSPDGAFYDKANHELDWSEMQIRQHGADQGVRNQFYYKLWRLVTPLSVHSTFIPSDSLQPLSSSPMTPSYTPRQPANTLSHMSAMEYPRSMKTDRPAAPNSCSPSTVRGPPRDTPRTPDARQLTQETSSAYVTAPEEREDVPLTAQRASPSSFPASLIRGTARASPRTPASPSSQGSASAYHTAPEEQEDASLTAQRASPSSFLTSITRVSARASSRTPAPPSSQGSASVYHTAPEERETCEGLSISGSNVRAYRSSPPSQGSPSAYSTAPGARDDLSLSRGNVRAYRSPPSASAETYNSVMPGICRSIRERERSVTVSPLAQASQRYKDRPDPREGFYLLSNDLAMPPVENKKEGYSEKVADAFFGIVQEALTTIVDVRKGLGTFEYCLQEDTCLVIDGSKMSTAPDACWRHVHRGTINAVLVEVKRAPTQPRDEHKVLGQEVCHMLSYLSESCYKSAHLATKDYLKVYLISWHATTAYFSCLEMARSQLIGLQKSVDLHGSICVRRSKIYNIMDPQERVEFAGGIVGVLVATLEQLKRYEKLVKNIKKECDRT